MLVAKEFLFQNFNGTNNIKYRDIVQKMNSQHQTGWPFMNKQE